MKRYVQYGCGLSAPVEWENYDVSPTLRIQKTPLLGKLLNKKLNTRFPGNVRYGDIVKGLPVKDNSCDGVYCSHTLEHLSLSDFRRAIANTLSILKPGGIFRCVVPDLEWLARTYIEELESGNATASIDFVGNTLLGVHYRPVSLKDFMISFFGNSHHLWMWDHRSLAYELKKTGFTDVRRCKFNDCVDEAFKKVEDEGRFSHAAAIEAKKIVG